MVQSFFKDELPLRGYLLVYAVSNFTFSFCTPYITYKDIQYNTVSARKKRNKKDKRSSRD